MKKILFAAIAVFATAFVSCGKFAKSDEAVDSTFVDNVAVDSVDSVVVVVVDSVVAE